MQNVIGRQLAWFRNQRGMSQNDLVTKVHLLGYLNMTRDILLLSKVLRCVATCKTNRILLPRLWASGAGFVPQKKRHFVGKDAGINLRFFAGNAANRRQFGNKWVSPHNPKPITFSWPADATIMM